MKEVEDGEKNFVSSDRDRARGRRFEDCSAGLANSSLSLSRRVRVTRNCPFLSIEDPSSYDAAPQIDSIWTRGKDAISSSDDAKTRHVCCFIYSQRRTYDYVAISNRAHARAMCKAPSI